MNKLVSNIYTRWIAITIFYYFAHYISKDKYNMTKDNLYGLPRMVLVVFIGIASVWLFPKLKTVLHNKLKNIIILSVLEALCGSIVTFIVFILGFNTTQQAVIFGIMFFIVVATVLSVRRFKSQDQNE